MANIDPSQDYKLLLVGAAAKGAASSVAKAFIDNAVVPFLRGRLKGKIESKIKSSISKYIRNVEVRTRQVPCIAIPGGKFFLESIYEPLSVVFPRSNVSVLIDEYPNKMFEMSRCVAITDDAGMGKSTLAKYILRKSIERNKSIPIFVELRRLRKGMSIIKSIADEISSGDSAVSEEFVKLIESGNFVFIFDGYDEVDDEIKSEVALEINDVSSKFQFCYFVLTSRKGYGNSVFPEYMECSIQKLSEAQAKSLLNRYDNGSGASKILISKIKKTDVSDFLGNPLLVTLLYKAFDYRPSIPLKKGIFYRQVYEALFQDHDLSKGDAFERKKKSGLDLDEFHRFLRALGFVTLSSGRVSYTAEEFVENIDEAVWRTQLNVETKNIISDLLRAVPLFVKEGVEYRWMHKSFQEYFASNYILYDLRDRTAEFIKKAFDSDPAKFSEIFRFIYEVNSGLILDHCVEPIYSKYFSDGISDEDYLRSFLASNTKVFFGAGEDAKGAFGILINEDFRGEFSIRHSVFHSASKKYMCLLSRGDVARMRVVKSLDSDNFFGSYPANSKFEFDFEKKLPIGKGLTEIDLNSKKISYSDLSRIASHIDIPIIENKVRQKIISLKDLQRRIIEKNIFSGF